jgi:hypothetical protein
MPLDRRALAFSLSLALLAAACGGAAATATPGGAAAASEAAASQAAAASAVAGGGLSGLPGSAPALEAMLPSSVGGVAFTKTSFGGGALPATIPVGSDTMGTFLQANGKTLADVSMAMATATDPTKAGTFIMAFQVAGVDATKLAQVLAGSSTSDLQTTTIGGKQVQTAGAAGMGFTLYTKGDVVFYILAIGDASLTEGILAALP